MCSIGTFWLRGGLTTTRGGKVKSKARAQQPDQCSSQSSNVAPILYSSLLLLKLKRWGLFRFDRVFHLSLLGLVSALSRDPTFPTVPRVESHQDAGGPVLLGPSTPAHSSLHRPYQTNKGCLLRPGSRSPLGFTVRREGPHMPIIPGGASMGRPASQANGTCVWIPPHPPFSLQAYLQSKMAMI